MYAHRDGHPLSALPAELAGLDDAELASHGIYHVVECVPEHDPLTHTLAPDPVVGYDEAGPIPVVTLTYQLAQRSPEEIATHLDVARTARCKAVAAELERRLQAGFTYDFGAPVGVKTLQTRDALDRTNWLAVHAVADRLVASGQGSEPMRPIRAADNTMVPVTAAQAQVAMLAMQSYLGGLMAHAWTLKDATMSETPVNGTWPTDISVGWDFP